MGVICKYKFDSSIYADLIPEFNSEYSGYTITDEVEGNIITRTIESDKLPTLMRFGRVWVSGESDTDNRTDSLLEVLDMNINGLTDCNNMFRYCKNLTSITCEWDTSNVTNMNQMFYNCNVLTSLDVSNWNTSKVTNMNGMFQYCNNLTSLDVSNFNTSKVITMVGMFRNCAKLTSLDVSNFNTSNVTNMGYMFAYCNSITSLDVSNFNTSKVTNMGHMFYSCSNLTELDVSCFDTTKVTNMNGMFCRCTALRILDVSNWITSNLSGISTMFATTNLYEIKGINNWDTSKINSVNGCFASCYKIKELDLSNWKLSADITNYEGIFTSCHNLRVLNISNFHIPSNANINSFISNSIKHIILLNSDIDTISRLGSYGDCQNATIYVDESLDQSQYTGTAPLKVYKEEKLEIKLNSPLLEGDTIEVVDGKLCHVHRWDKVVLDGSENWASPHNFFWIQKKYLPSPLKEREAKKNSVVFVDTLAHGYIDNNTVNQISTNRLRLAMQDSVNGGTNIRIILKDIKDNDIDGLKQWLSENPTTIIYELETPYYEDITPLQSSITLKTFLESSMTIDTILPIETKLSYRTNVPSISTLSTRATELAESDNVIHNLMNIIDDEVDE